MCLQVEKWKENKRNLDTEILQQKRIQESLLHINVNIG